MKRLRWIQLWDGRWELGWIDHGLATFPFGHAPAGLATRRQLRQVGLCPGGQDIVAQIVWSRGRQWAGLYRLDLAQPKRVPTVAQLRSLAAAMAARRRCHQCGHDAAATSAGTTPATACPAPPACVGPASRPTPPHRPMSARWPREYTAVVGRRQPNPPDSACPSTHQIREVILSMTSNYVQDTVDALTHRVGKPDGSDADLMRLYALLVHTTGTATSLQDVHDAWALWRTRTKPEHADLVEFEQLPPGVQDYDRPYRDAIRDLAAARSEES